MLGQVIWCRPVGFVVPIGGLFDLVWGVRG